jgi:hypothetical protein
VLLMSKLHSRDDVSFEIKQGALTSLVRSGNLPTLRHARDDDTDPSKVS